ncbi:hypothetical protein BC939DRAFT_440618 [Gamsiella multidivaricata]|uniref:uncharacterized protein n=1 Tax=Gamsiella multidivaricata TaxID=101098 RepID=UPI002220C00A|nr:uncharacterized protein BC939DRAFT_440618 [Gamsiella multidivaricata]KAI7829796.1 hypothetical protein BC939DRAFT_440618 [Gamsiella multidivaricata]
MKRIVPLGLSPIFLVPVCLISKLIRPSCAFNLYSCSTACKRIASEVLTGTLF